MEYSISSRPVRGMGLVFLAALAGAALMASLLPTSASAALEGYTQVSSPTVQALPSQAASAKATCPMTAFGQTVPLSGGVLNSASTTLVNSSYPDPDGISWDGTGNNGGTNPSSVQVFAVCAPPFEGYAQVAAASTANPAGQQTDATASCPAGTDVLGGGGQASSSAVGVDINSSFPTGLSTTTPGWQANMNNGGPLSQSFTVYAICANPFDGYSTGSYVTNNDPGTVTAANGGCGSGDFVLGGGISASSSSTLVNIESTYPPNVSGHAEWDNYESNASSASDIVTPWSICTTVGYVHPRGATRMRTPLVPAYMPCTSANTNHGAPLSHPSCAPPVQSSNFLTVGTPDTNGAGANSSSWVTYTVQVNAPPTPNDLVIEGFVTDVRCKLPVNTTCGSANAAAGPDYTGQLQGTVNLLRVTDRFNDEQGTSNLNQPGTVIDIPSFPVPFPCHPTPETSTGSICGNKTSLSALFPGSGGWQSGKRAIWELGQVKVYDGGAGGVAGSSDATLFMDEGVFVP